jgi:hypothetical protein
MQHSHNLTSSSTALETYMAPPAASEPEQLHQPSCKIAGLMTQHGRPQDSSCLGRSGGHYSRYRRRRSYGTRWFLPL